MPSVFAADIPLATLSVDNIQVRAEWDVVGDDANHFRLDGTTLMMLTSNISGAGYPAGNTITAIVEVRDKFSTLNSSYEDLTVRVMITAVIMGCHADWSRNLAKDWNFKNKRELIVESDTVSVGDVIMNTVSAGSLILHEVNYSKWRLGSLYITTSPELYDSLKWNVGGSPSGWTSLLVNESADCFAEEVKAFQEQQILQQKTQYLNANAPLISGAVTVAYGVIAVEGRAVTVGTAFVLDGKQHFYLNLTLANILNELYTPKVIIDDGKVFSIDNKYPSDNRYEYVSNLTAGSDSVDKQSPHEVIVVNNCPPIYEVIGWKEYGLRISASDFDKVRKYMIINGTIYADISTAYAGISTIKGVESHGLGVPGNANFGVTLPDGDYPIKFSDHFLCGTG